MKIEVKECVVLKVTEVIRLDPLTITMEDIENSKGRITISCFDQSWTGYWGAMGGRSLAQFFISCDEHYLAGCMSSLNSEALDHDNLDKWLKASLLKKRRERDYSRQEARKLFNDIVFDFDSNESWQHSDTFYNLAREIIGDEYWVDFPMVPNHRYQYLCRVINTTKDALKVYMGEQEVTS